jgi:hypothetical protein
VTCDQADPFSECYDPEHPDVPTTPAKIYYAYGPSLNQGPSTNPYLWDTTPPPTTRFYSTASIAPNTPTGPSCATILSSVYAVYDLVIAKSCATGNIANGYSYWVDGPLVYSGGINYGNTTYYAIAGVCTNPLVYAENNSLIAYHQTA